MRRVILQLYASVPLSAITGISPQRIREELINNGWNISSVQQITRVFYPTQGLTWLIIANVGTEFSQSQIEDTAKAVLSNILNNVRVDMIDASSVQPGHDVILSTNPTEETRLLDDITTVGAISGTTIAALVVAGVVGYLLLNRD